MLPNSTPTNASEDLLSVIKTAGVGQAIHLMIMRGTQQLAVTATRPVAKRESGPMRRAGGALRC